MRMLKKIISLLGGKWWALVVVLLIAIALFLRLNLIYETATFLGDQGRDAIVMRNIATLRDFPALGPITSVGSIYLGPLYYYLMAPWLLLTAFNPIGPAIGIALISTASLVLQYIFVKEMTNKHTAFLSLVFSTFSWVLVEYGRFSWNPNLLPQTTFFAIYTLYKIVKTKEHKYFIIHGLLLSLAIQLHYLSLFLLPVTVVVLLYQQFVNKKLTFLFNPGPFFSLAGAFILPFSPFIIFEIMKGFPNFRSILHFSSTNSSTSNEPFLNELTNSLQNTLQFAFQISLSQPYVLAIGLGLFVCLVFALKRRSSMAYIFGAALVMIIGVSFYRGPKYAHYVGGTYILLYVGLSYILGRLITWNKAAGLIVSICSIILFLSLNIPKYYFLYEKEHQSQIDRAYEVSRTIITMNPTENFTLTSSPEAYADYPYRYYLDVLGKKPIAKEADSYSPSESLFVVCQTECRPMSDPQWAIAHFNPKKVEQVVTVSKYPEYKIYKLTR